MYYSRIGYSHLFCRNSIKNWVVKNLVDCDDPRVHGKALKGNLAGIWRYRVGDYRLFADIHDNVVTIEIFEIAHRSKIYK
ncbi:MAG: type II toxin-antitoxin system RelE family toxin [Christensenellales bacterium]